MSTLSVVSEKLKSAKSVAIVFHVRPDGDSVGGGLALYRTLKAMGKDAEVFCSDAIPSRFKFLADYNRIKATVVGEYDLFVSLDCADASRMGDISMNFSACKNTINIDHHVSNSRFAKENYVFDASSNCENIFSLIKEMDVPVDEETANLLLMGILTDTGNFQHKNVSSATFNAASELVDLGANVNELSYRMFNMQSKARANLFGRVMSKIDYYLDDRLAVIKVFKKDFADTGATRDDTEGFIDFVMGVEGVQVGIALSETDKGMFKASLRSKGPDVNAVANVYGGGGHTLASGCQLQGDYYEIIDKLVFTVSQYLES